ncbi:2-oxoglutarate dehydrogenase E1 component OS=Ureibacillus acetophenoni OX=614649 GN=odhA PE=3 SV=1 [Ureibacillus acetophenoni]
MQLADAIRSFGHLAADIYPLKDRKLDTTKIEASYYGLTEADLVAIPASRFFTVPPANVSNGKQAVDFLRSIYTDKIGFEFSHVEDKNEREWIQAKIESGLLNKV